MPDLKLYLNEKEMEYVKSKGKGFVRGLVREVMNVGSVEPYQKTVSHKVHRGIVCPKCGEGLAFIGQQHKCR